MSKVLIIGPDFFGYNESIANAFINNGWKADVINYFDGRSMTIKQLISSIFNKNYFFDINKFQTKTKYDLILMVKGTKISIEKINELKKFSNKFYLWIMDPITLFPEINNKISIFDKIFTFQKKDIDILKSKNKDTFYLPLFFDESIFGNYKNKKTIDFVFIGNLYEQRARELDDFCKSVLASNTNLNIQIYGGYGFLKLLQFLKIKKNYQNLSKFLKFGLVSPKKASMLYSKTKVGINIHVSSQTGLNMRFFELYGSSVVQVLPNCNIELNEIEIDKNYIKCNQLNLEVVDTILKMEINSLDQNIINMHSSKDRIKEIINAYNN